MKQMDGNNCSTITIGLNVINRIVDSAFYVTCGLLLIIFFFASPGFYVTNLPGLSNTYVLIYTIIFLILVLIVLYESNGLTDNYISLLFTFAWSPQYWLLTVLPLGDDWFIQAQQLPCCMFSEALGHALYKFIFTNELWHITPFIAPAAGSVTCYLVLRTLLLLTSDIAENHRTEWRFFSILLFVSSGVNLIYFKDYIETTQIASPFAVLSVYLLIRFCKTGRIVFSYYAAVFWSLAFLVHASNIFWWPVFFIISYYVDCYYHRKKCKFCFLLPGLLSIILIIVIMLMLNSVEGYRIFAGGAAGGGDGKMFVPLMVASSRYEHYLLFSQSHFSDVATIMSITNFFFIFAGPIYLLSWRKIGKSKDLYLEPLSMLFVLIFLAHFTMVFFWNFDLGFPHDYDLMTSIGMLWLGLPLLLIMNAQTRPPASAWLVLLCGVIINRLNISLYVS